MKYQPSLDTLELRCTPTPLPPIPPPPDISRLIQSVELNIILIEQQKRVAEQARMEWLKSLPVKTVEPLLSEKLIKAKAEVRMRESMVRQAEQNLKTLQEQGPFHVIIQPLTEAIKAANEAHIPIFHP